jgi:hypothetical protein
MSFHSKCLIEENVLRPRAFLIIYRRTAFVGGPALSIHPPPQIASGLPRGYVVPGNGVEQLRLDVDEDVKRVLPVAADGVQRCRGAPEASRARVRGDARVALPALHARDEAKRPA